MERKDPSTEIYKENDLKRVSPMQLNNHKPRVTAVSCTSFPEAVSRIVGDYLPDSEREYVVAALVGVQPITLCLSQDVDSPLGTCWSMGFLPSDHPWDSWHVEVDKKFSITDVEGCFSFLNEKGSDYCRLVIEVLVVKLSMTSSNSPSALEDLRNTIQKLQDNLNSVKRVVFSITEHSSCCFTLKNSPDNGAGISPPVDHQQVLLQIVNDFETCWKINEMLSVQDVFAFYFKGVCKPASEEFLARFVVSLAHPLSQTLFEEEASNISSNKLMWITSLESVADFYHVDQNTTRLCHVINLNMPSLRFNDIEILGDRLEHVFCYRDNIFIERIVVNFNRWRSTVQLPRPDALFKDTTRLSALIEITLLDFKETFHLTNLNNNFFPRLAHLSIIGGQITGHLDRCCVPDLRTLILEPGRFVDRSHPTVGSLVSEHTRSHTRSLLLSGRPWQIVATKEPGGWSLASYEVFTSNPQDDEKEDAPHSLLLIRELLLVIGNQSNADEWHSQLTGKPSLEAAAKDHSDRILVWSPELVEKITVFCTSEDHFRVEFKEEIPGHIRILTSLTCYYVTVVIDGVVLPHLQSLETNDSHVKISGTFPHLQALSFLRGVSQGSSRFNAPLLQSLRCDQVVSAESFEIRPYLLPRLSFLRITLSQNHFSFPQILDDEDNLGLSRIKHVVIGKHMSFAPTLNQCRIYDVLHLSLTVNAFSLPACWFKAEWRCEILELSVDASTTKQSHPPKKLDLAVLPPLPHVKTLTVTAMECQVLLNKEMSKLAYCTVPSPKSLGSNLKCPALKRIRFTDQLTEGDKKKYLDTATYEAIGARPREVFFDFDGEEHTIHWPVAPIEEEMLPLHKPVEADGFLVVFQRMALSFVSLFFSVSSSDT